MKAETKLTPLEIEVLQNIANSEYMDVDSFDDMIKFPVWSFSVVSLMGYPLSSTNKLKGALGSCVKKGLVECQQTKSEDEECWLTEKGVEILKETGYSL